MEKWNQLVAHRFILPLLFICSSLFSRAQFFAKVNSNQSALIIYQNVDQRKVVVGFAGLENKKLPKKALKLLGN